MAPFAKLFARTLLCTSFMFSSASLSAHAESVKQSAKEQVNWYAASRQMQIIDDRPVIRDFRQLPQHEATIELPAQPTSAVYGGRGAGSMDTGSFGTIPRGGMHLQNQGLAYRAPINDEKATSSTNGIQSAKLQSPNQFAGTSPTSLPKPIRGSLLHRSQSM